MTDNRIGRENEVKPWYVMCHLDPQKIETLLQMDCDGKFRHEGDEEREPYRFYVPYMYIPVMRRSKTDKDKSGDKQYQPQDDIIALRNDLHNFVFIQAPAERVRAIVDSEWNTRTRLRLYYYRDTDRREVTISDAEMHQLMATIQDRHLQFYIDQPVDDFTPGDRVILKMEPWVGRRGEVRKIAIKKGQLCLTISMNILGRTKSINFTDVRVGDVLFENAERGRMLSDNPITNYEEEMIDILSHRFGHHYSDDVAKADQQRLKRLATYDHIYVDDDSEKARFFALKLMCAYLLKNSKKREFYLQQVMDLLAPSLVGEGEDRGCQTDADAYLMTALLVVTRNVKWRSALKEYRVAHPDCPDVFRRYHAILKNLKTRKRK